MMRSKDAKRCEKMRKDAKRCHTHTYWKRLTGIRLQEMVMRSNFFCSPFQPFSISISCIGAKLETKWWKQIRFCFRLACSVVTLTTKRTEKILCPNLMRKVVILVVNPPFENLSLERKGEQTWSDFQYQKRADALLIFFY